MQDFLLLIILLICLQCWSVLIKLLWTVLSGIPELVS